MANSDFISFTVVIPLFNKRQYIRRTLQGVLGQTHHRFEVVIVDDGSTDGSSEEIADLLGEQVRLVRQPNSGPGRARNRGFAEARSAWVALLDGDDMWMPDHLETLAGLISDFPAADGVASGHMRVARQELPRVQQDGEEARGLLDYFRAAATSKTREALWTSAVAVRRAAFHQTRGFGDFWPGEDLEFWARFALDHRFASSGKVTALYTVGSGGLMDSGEMSENMALEPWRQPVFDTLDGALANVNYSDKHADIRFYRDSLLAQTAKQALYRGDVRAAKTCLRLMSHRGGLQLRAYQLAASLPEWFTIAGVKAYRSLKRLKAAAPG